MEHAINHFLRFKTILKWLFHIDVFFLNLYKNTIL